MVADAVPVLRELSGQELAAGVQPDGTITVVFDGLRLPLALPPLAPAILRLVDGRRSVGEIAATLAERGTGSEAFERAWQDTFSALERINRLVVRRADRFLLTRSVGVVPAGRRSDHDRRRIIGRRRSGRCRPGSPKGQPGRYRCTRKIRGRRRAVNTGGGG